MFEAKTKFRGIVRNRIADLNQCKGRKKAPIKRFSKAALRKTLSEEVAMKSNLLTEETKPSQIQMTFVQEPIWMSNYKQCCTLLKEVQFLQAEIGKQKLKKLSAVCQKKHDRMIQQFTEEATVKLNKCEHKLKEMEHAANFDPTVSITEKRTFTSMLFSMAINIRDQARKLRGQQQSELRRERELKNSTKNILDIQSESTETESWLQEKQFEMLQKSMLKERDQQITKIVQSIYSLNAIYKDLQGLVIEQGSLLDRIDEHIQKAVQSVSEARKHLEKARENQDSSCLKKVRRTLIILIGLMLIVFIFKHV